MCSLGWILALVCMTMLIVVFVRGATVMRDDWNQIVSLRRHLIKIDPEWLRTYDAEQRHDTRLWYPAHNTKHDDRHT